MTKKFLPRKIRKLLQSMSDITKCEKVYYIVRQVLQSVTIITNCDSTILYQIGTKVRNYFAMIDLPLLEGSR